MQVRPTKLLIVSALSGATLWFAPVTVWSAPAVTPAKQAPVLSPDSFKHPMKLGYSAAQKYPDVLAKLFCYCGCDLQDDHTSLLQCYQSSHGAYCAICLEEAIEAKQLKESGAPLRKIQEQIDNHFAKNYPFPNKPSPILVQYRDSLKASGIKITTLAKTAGTADGARNPKSNCCAHQN